ncbi:MAG TPA: iron ABC transporter substrate-binding protein [Thermomicrobiales bacterium]|nr:iron ABC transporter substrate-binding protein [Thermomicrobiales bacterium]
MTTRDGESRGGSGRGIGRRRLLTLAAGGAAGLALTAGGAGRANWTALAQTAVADPEADPEADPVADPTAGASPASGDTLTIYAGQHASTVEAIAAAFTKATGIPVQIRSGEDAELANQLVAEGASSPADVVITENSPALMLLSEQKLLAPVDAATLARVPERYNSPNDDWVGTAARETVLVYNPALLPAENLPQSVLDLAKPEWQGKIGIAPAESDFQPLVAAVAKLEGRDAAAAWLDGLARNAETYQGNFAILRAVEAGDLAAGIINHYYWFRLAKEVGADQMHSKLYYFRRHDPGALVNVSGAGVLAAGRHPDEAQRFLAFLVSDAGQAALVASGDFEYPLAKGDAAAPGLEPFDKLEPPAISIADLGDGREAVELLQDAGLL